MSIENNSNYELMDIDEEEPTKIKTINQNKYKYYYNNAQKTNNNPNNTKNYNINTVGAKYNNIKNEIKPVKSHDTRK